MHANQLSRVRAPARVVLVFAGLLAAVVFASGKSAPQCIPVEPETPVWSFVEVWYETSGGFTGGGATDITVEDWTVTVHDPFADPGDCTTLLQGEWLDDLVSAAGTVDWDGVAPTYVSPDNPYCCCDQIISDLTVRLTRDDGSTRTVTTRWCSESAWNGEMPQALLDFVGVVAEVGVAAGGHCGW